MLWSATGNGGDALYGGNGGDGGSFASYNTVGDSMYIDLTDTRTFSTVQDSTGDLP